MGANHHRNTVTLKPTCGAKGRIIQYSQGNVTCKRCLALMPKANPTQRAPQTENA